MALQKTLCPLRRSRRSRGSASAPTPAVFVGGPTVTRRRGPFHLSLQRHECGRHVAWCMTHTSRTRSTRGPRAPPPAHGSSLSPRDASCGLCSTSRPGRSCFSGIPLGRGTRMTHAQSDDFGGVSFSLGDLRMTPSAAARAADENSRPGGVFALGATALASSRRVAAPAGPRRPPGVVGP